MDANNLKFSEIIFSLLFVFAFFTGVGALEFGYTLLGIVILVPIFIIVGIDFLKIPNETFQKIHAKQTSTITRKFFYYLQLFITFALVIYTINLAINWF